MNEPMSLEQASFRLHELSSNAYGVANQALGTELWLIADAIDAELTSREGKGDAVAWQYRDVGSKFWHFIEKSFFDDWSKLDDGSMELRTLYTHPAAQEAAKPVEQVSGEKRDDDDAVGMVTRIHDELIFQPFEGWREAIAQGNNWLYLHSSQNIAKPKPEQAVGDGVVDERVSPAQRAAVSRGEPSHDARGNLILRTAAEGEAMLRSGSFDPR